MLTGDYTQNRVVSVIAIFRQLPNEAWAYSCFSKVSDSSTAALDDDLSV